jgi:hypothetical protein
MGDAASFRPMGFPPSTELSYRDSNRLFPSDNATSGVDSSSDPLGMPSYHRRVGSETTDCIVGALARHGWMALDAEESTPLEEVARAVLGRHAPERLQPSILWPREQRAASPFSLSSTFGLATFDAHTDGAAHPVPPRWCFLRLTPGSVTKTPTLLWDIPTLGLEARRLDVLRRAMWVVSSGARTFYTSVLRRHGAREIWRFNRVCMRPVSRRAAQAGEELASTLLLSAPTAHHWKHHEVLVFDNWRVAHARPGVGKRDVETRRLERLLVPEEE